ncbi:transposase [Azoarcus indigens]|uniref:IS66 family transposase n=1 Tax=Azoarcus indigens TaxID=29545 RepID=UPI0013C2BA3A|nr:transposase [Azoarcus indigens]
MIRQFDRKRCPSPLSRRSRRRWRAARPKRANALLASYPGIVQCDGYAAYKALAGDVILAFCWAHVRRGLFELAKGGAAPIAAEVLQRIAPLYVIEAEIRGRPAEERLAVRQARSRPLAAELFTWLDAHLGRLPRSRRRLPLTALYAASRD